MTLLFGQTLALLPVYGENVVKISPLISEIDITDRSISTVYILLIFLIVDPRITITQAALHWPLKLHEHPVPY